MIALSNETPDLVASYLDQHGVSVPVAARSTGGQGYGVKGIPASFLIDPTGEIVYAGHPSGVTSGKVKSALKGAKKPSDAQYMAYQSVETWPKALGKAVDAAGRGELGRALLAVQKLVTDEETSPDLRDAAEKFGAEVSGFVEDLRKQLETLIERREVLPALEAYEGMAKHLRGLDVGEDVASRLKELEKDEDIQREVNAAEALEKARAAAERRGVKKAVKKFEAVRKKFEGTRAAERAEAILRNA